MNATNKRKGDVTASASHAEGEADSLLHGLRRRSPLGRVSSERLTGPVWKRFGDKSRSRRSTTHASLHRPDVERSTLRDRVRSRGLRTTSTPIVSGSRLQREAVNSGSMEEGGYRSACFTLCRIPGPRTGDSGRDWNKGRSCQHPRSRKMCGTVRPRRGVTRNRRPAPVQRRPVSRRGRGPKAAPPRRAHANLQNPRRPFNASPDNRRGRS